MFKSFQEFDDLEARKLFDLCTAPTRGSWFEISLAQLPPGQYKIFFSLRVVDIWNSLSEGIIARDTSNKSNARLDEIISVWSRVCKNILQLFLTSKNN